ncbi:tryptophan synthase subunit alpha [Candidatus Woesearchaeota archaeon]|jgi:tryptophan synthase alpha chain|nr:tryptophan synthase subunit alpha [Candidatus Woesearchaeota archaeon]|tara:strand:- start:2300 stop:3109 length:810 start_codon:yes stop_codon:yes gene_type:complete
MKRYKKAFKKLKNKNEGALVAFIVIGDPDFETSLEIAKSIIKAGADILELGLPFSDPIADGKTIQAADIRALKSGFNTKKAFEFVRELRKFTDIPIGFLSYYNLIYQYGIEKFFNDVKNYGIDSVLVADVPIEEFGILSKFNKKFDVDTVLMTSPLTNNERIKKITANTTGFVYVVSRLGVTGAKSDLKKSTLNLVRRIRQFTEKPLCVGFGISTPEQVQDVIGCGADGAIVGSAIIDLIENNIANKEKMLNEIYKYANIMKTATKRKV